MASVVVNPVWVYESPLLCLCVMSGFGENDDENAVAYKLNQKFALSIPLGTLVGAVEVEDVLVGAGALDAVPGMH